MEIELQEDRFRYVKIEETMSVGGRHYFLLQHPEAAEPTSFIVDTGDQLMEAFTNVHAQAIGLAFVPRYRGGNYVRIGAANDG